MRFEKVWENPTVIKVGVNKWEPTQGYILWKGMVSRCGNAKNYEDVQVSEEFLDYDLWLDWAKQQKGFLEKDEKGRVFASDKDLLAGGSGKLYSRDTVLFLPRQLNGMITRTSKSGLRGIQSFHKGGRIVHTVKFNLDGKTHYHGSYDDIEEAKKIAAEVWRNNLEKVATRYDLDDRVYDAIFHISY